MAAQFRIKIPRETETYVLVASRRRCCLCYFLVKNGAQRKGQIAHLNHNNRDCRVGNLAYLCLEHHDEFDSKTSQTKGISPREIRHYRDALHEALGTSTLRPRPPGQTESVREIRIDNPSKQHPLAFLSLPWRSVGIDDGVPTLFAYKSSNRCDGICRIELRPLKDDKILVICEEIDENPGLSVTNNIEYLALQLCRRFGIKPKALVLLEHYRTSYVDEREWNLVEFRTHSRNHGFSGPEWRPMNEMDWRALGYQPRKRYGSGPSRESLLVEL